MQSVQRAGAGRTKIRIKSGLGRVTVYRKNNPNKPFKKPLTKGDYTKATKPTARFSPLPSALMVF
ncbi:MAG: hypothetical protein AAF960_09265 [Bacteroidota bacterium]